MSKSDRELLTTGGSCQVPTPRFSFLDTQVILMQMRGVWALRYTGLKIFAFSCLFTLVKGRGLGGEEVLAVRTDSPFKEFGKGREEIEQ